MAVQYRRVYDTLLSDEATDEYPDGVPLANVPIKFVRTGGTITTDGIIPKGIVRTTTNGAGEFEAQLFCDGSGLSASTWKFYGGGQTGEFSVAAGSGDLRLSTALALGISTDNEPGATLLTFVEQRIDDMLADAVPDLTTQLAALTTLSEATDTVRENTETERLATVTAREATEAATLLAGETQAQWAELGVVDSDPDQPYVDIATIDPLSSFADGSTDVVVGDQTFTLDWTDVTYGDPPVTRRVIQYGALEAIATAVDALVTNATNAIAAIQSTADTAIAAAAVDAAAAIAAAAIHDLAVFAPGRPYSSEPVYEEIAGRTMIFAAGLAGVYGKASTNPTATYVFSLQKDGVEFGTVTFNTDGTITAASVSGATIPVGHLFTIKAAAVVDATLAGVKFFIPWTTS